MRFPSVRAFEEGTLMDKTPDYLRDEYGVFESGNLSKSRCIYPLFPNPILCEKNLFCFLFSAIVSAMVKTGKL